MEEISKATPANTNVDPRNNNHLGDGNTGVVSFGENTEYRRLLYYEVIIERAGLDKSITIGAGLGEEFTYLLSSTVRGVYLVHMVDYLIKIPKIWDRQFNY